MKRLVLCTGKVAYELMEARDKAGDKNISVVRIEQLYPFPGEPLTLRLKQMTNLEEVVWARRSRRTRAIGTSSNGASRNAWPRPGARPKRPLYAGREASASPATGLAKRHAAEQAELIADALGHSERAQAHRKAS